MAFRKRFFYKVMKGLLKRYLVFVLGLYFLSVGIVLIVKSSLGTTPISCLNYVVSINTPLTLGSATFLFNVLLIFIQFLLIRGNNERKDRIEILLQIPFSFLFGAFIDVNMHLLADVGMSGYAGCLSILAVGLLFQSVGVVLELKPNVAIMSAEGVVKYASRRYNKDFGRLKVGFDVLLVLSAVLVSVLMAGRIDGVREGTLIAAVFTGYAVSFLSRKVMTRANLHRITSLGR